MKQMADRLTFAKTEPTLCQLNGLRQLDCLVQEYSLSSNADCLVQNTKACSRCFFLALCSFFLFMYSTYSSYTYSSLAALTFFETS